MSPCVPVLGCYQILRVGGRFYFPVELKWRQMAQAEAGAQLGRSFVPTCGELILENHSLSDLPRVARGVQGQRQEEALGFLDSSSVKH